jgi:hypothetical protein
MATVTTKQIRELGKEIILQHPGGIRYAIIVSMILAKYPDANKTTVGAQVANYLVPAYPKEITKPGRGLYRPISTDSPDVQITAITPIPSAGFQKEEDIYEPFAQWLKNDIEEATEAVALGGSGLKTKWGTPDVVGVYKPLASQLIKFSAEIVAVEIKLDSSQPIVAFGQAIAYRLFAARTYVVMPSTMTAEDQSRLESLCLLFGVGFVLFDPSNMDTQFEIRVRAQRFSPDMFYVNEFASRLHNLDAAKFQILFG